jgi:endoglucanase
MCQSRIYSEKILMIFMKAKHRILILAGFLFLFQFGSLSATGFLKVQGKNIVDSAGNDVILKSIGIGGWWLQEGYMFEYSSFAKTQSEFKKKIEDLVGTENTEIFYDAFRKNFVTRRDVDSIASWGFNSIRLPMHYNLLISASDPDTFLVKGFQLIDSLVGWCRKNKLYLILDLHGAPGGQGHDAAISDYDTSKPSLWESQENKDLTVVLWKELARRYTDEKWIGGYDLINEPNWDLGTDNAALRNLYIEITNAIREVDTNHIIFIEGNWFATEFKGLTPPWDDNMVYSFHKYWSDYNTGSIQYLLDIRNNYNVPLWLGETGENSNHWFTQLTKLLQSYKIGWACWPYKKISSVTGHLTINKPAGYETLLNYWSGTADKPTVDFAMSALLALTDSLKIENCVYHPDVNNAWFTFTNNDQQIPFKKLTIPGIIFCSDYNMGSQNKAYFDSDYQNIGSGATSWNSGGQYRNDGVDMEACLDAITCGYNVGWLNPGEWMNYTIEVAEKSNFLVAVRYAGQSTMGKIHLELDGTIVTGTIDLNATGGWQAWVTKTMGSFSIDAGTHEIRIVAEAAGSNLNYLSFSVTTDLKETTENSENKFMIISNSSGGMSVIPTDVSYDQPFQIKIFDLTGRCLISKDFWGEYKIENQYPSGLYILTLSNGNYTSSQKFVINNN